MATPKQTDPQFKLRVPQVLKDRIEASAAANNRSMNAEIVLILEAAVFGDEARDERLARIEAKLDRLLATEDD